MTQNQIAFYKAKKEAEHYERSDSENVKHNRAVEAENYRHDYATENLEQEKNRLTEAYNTGTLEHFKRTDSEQARTNRENERLKSQQNLENIRHDVASEGIEREKNALTKQLNTVKEREQAETSKHNRVTEGLTHDKQWYEIQKLQADTQATKSNTLLDTVRLDQISSQAMLNLENVKNAGFDRLLTEQKVYSENALTELRKAQAEKTFYDAAYSGINTWSNAMKGVGGLLSGLKSVPFIIQNDPGYASSVSYNAYTGLYE